MVRNDPTADPDTFTDMVADWRKENELTDEDICHIIETDDYYNHQEEIDRQMAEEREKENETV